jgi:hypothetical protein
VCDPPDFSTDAGNSALILKTKSPRSHAYPIQRASRSE